MPPNIICWNVSFLVTVGLLAIIPNKLSYQQPTSLSSYRATRKNCRYYNTMTLLKHRKYCMTTSLTVT